MPSSDIATLRLYQQDSYATHFRARVLQHQQHDDHTTLVLDQTLFYAEAGGQASDVGTLYRLDDRGQASQECVARVVRVYPRHKHSPCIIHQVTCLQPIEEGEILQGVIDWQCRYHHMQRHSAQHILSQSLLRSHPRLVTVSVNMQHAVFSIDVAGEPSSEELTTAFRIANAQGYARLPIASLEVPESELAAYPLRRPTKVRGMVRLVYMGDDPLHAWELSACGGTHVANASEVLPLHMVRTERVKGRLTRVYCLSGLEAIADYQQTHQIAYTLAKDFSSTISELPSRVASLHQQLRDSQQQGAHVQTQLAQAWLSQWQHEAASQPGSIQLICKQLEDASMLKPLAQLVRNQSGMILCLAATQNDADTVRLLLARSDDVTCDMRPAFNQALQQLAGKGGGAPTLLQGAGTHRDTLPHILTTLRAQLAACVAAPSKTC